MTIHRYQVPFWSDKNVLKLIVVIILNSVNILKAIELSSQMDELYVM